MNKQMFRRAGLLGAALLLIVAGTASVAQAASLCVNPGGSGGCYGTIQAAVDAASDGDEIVIRAGKYVEQVTIIDKDLTLVGRGGAVVQAPIPMEQTLLDATGLGERPVIGVANAEVTVRNLTIDGANSSADNEFLVGIEFVNAGGVIRDNRIRNIGFGEPTLPVDPQGNPIYQGDGIFAINLEATPRTITIMKNRLVNFNNNGMTLVSVVDPLVPGPANLTVEVVGNTVIALGPNDVIDQWGIFLVTDTFDGSLDPPAESYATGSIRGNHVRDVATVAPYGLPGIGIVTGNTSGVDIADNVVKNVNGGIDVARFLNAQIAENRITGHGPGAAASYGIALSGSDIQVTENRFKRFDVGIFLFIQDEFYGSAFSTALDENRFDHVGVDVLTQAAVSPMAAAGAPQTSPKWQRYRPVTQP
jgi:hypothetical protein